MSLRLKPLLLLCAISGCSVYMEATRPTPTDLTKFHPGDSRTSVMENLGSPVDTSKGESGDSCDLYLLYLRGYGTAGKVPIAVVESAADFFTLGLAEIVLSPTEAVTRNEKRPVWFCYQNDALLSVTPKSAESATPTPTPETPTPSSASPTPTASLASTPVPSENPTPTDLATPITTPSPTPTATAPTGE
jgi:hypothetical protein